MADGSVRGHFTTALVRGLRGAAALPDGQVTSLSLNNYLFQSIGPNLHPDTDFYPIHVAWLITRVPPPPPVRVRVATTGTGTEVQLEDSHFQLIPATAFGPPVWEFQVQPGLYRARETAQSGPPIRAERVITVTPGVNQDVRFT
jgi:hypothetical protein